MHDTKFWNGKRVLVTGHTGFKGTWLSLWLNSLGAKVIGYSLAPPTIPNLFQVTNGGADCQSCYCDIHDFSKLTETVTIYQPEIVFHLAAQSLVRKSYEDPVQTFQTNVLGTVHLLEAVRQSSSVKVVVNVTSDKCYENQGERRAFQENDRMGGNDPYSASKGCAELVTESYNRSFFRSVDRQKIKLVTVRAGNVIGGGDWAEERLFPDIMRAFLGNGELIIRNPHAVRPWQHVLDPLHGYLLLAKSVWDDSSHCGGWNFGPTVQKDLSVSDIVKTTMQLWKKELNVKYEDNRKFHEAAYLKLDSSKAMQYLNWSPKLSVREAVEWTVQWFQHYESGADMRAVTINQIKNFEERAMSHMTS